MGSWGSRREKSQPRPPAWWRAVFKVINSGATGSGSREAFSTSSLLSYGRLLAMRVLEEVDVVVRRRGVGPAVEPDFARPLNSYTTKATRVHPLVWKLDAIIRKSISCTKVYTSYHERQWRQRAWGSVVSRSAIICG